MEFFDTLVLNEIAYCVFVFGVPFAVYTSLFFILNYFKGNRRYIIVSIILSLLVSAVVVPYLAVRSYYLHPGAIQTEIIWIYGSIGLLLFYGFYVNLDIFIYAWFDDETYKKLTVPREGGHISQPYPRSKFFLRLQAGLMYIGCLIGICFMPFFVVGIFIELENFMLWVALTIIPMCTSGAFALLSRMIFNIFDRCPHCNFSILHPLRDRSDNIGLGSHTVMRAILFSRQFKCANCGATYQMRASKSGHNQVEFSTEESKAG